MRVPSRAAGCSSVTVTNVAGPNDDRLQTKDVCECLRHILRILGTLYKFEQTFQFAMGFLRNKDLTIRSELVIKDDDEAVAIVPVALSVRNMKLSPGQTAKRIRAILNESQLKDDSGKNAPQRVDRPWYQILRGMNESYLILSTVNHCIRWCELCEAAGMTAPETPAPQAKSLQLSCDAAAMLLLCARMALTRYALACVPMPVAHMPPRSTSTTN